MIGFVMVGCGSDDNDDADNNAIDQGNARGTAAQMQIDVDFTNVDANAQIAMAGEILITIDEGEIMEAQAALPVLTDGEAVDFANRMINEHTQHSADTSAVLANLGISPADSATAAMLRNEAAASVRDIQAANDPDFVYMQSQVTDHQEALMIVRRLDDHIDEPSMDTFLKQTANLIQTHRDDASAILRDL